MTRQNLYHVVLIKFNDDVSTEVRAAMLARYKTIDLECGGEEAGILFWHVKENLDQRKGWHLVEIAIFTGNDALQRFRAHPLHVALVGDLSKIANWVVGDIETTSLFD